MALGLPQNQKKSGSSKGPKEPRAMTRESRQRNQQIPGLRIMVVTILFGFNGIFYGI